MSEERIKIASGVIMYNSEGNIFLARGEKWKGKWAIPGGGLEYGETFEQCIRREVREEIGVEIKNVQFIDTEECIFPEGFHKKMHFLFLDFLAQIKDDNEVITLNDEFTEYGWFEPEEAKKIVWNQTTADFVQKYIDYRDKGLLKSNE